MDWRVSCCFCAKKMNISHSGFAQELVSMETSFDLFDYCSGLYTQLHHSLLQKLHLVQNIAASLLSSTFKHTCPLLPPSASSRVQCGVQRPPVIRAIHGWSPDYCSPSSLDVWSHFPKVQVQTHHLTCWTLFQFTEITVNNSVIEAGTDWTAAYWFYIIFHSFSFYNSFLQKCCILNTFQENYFFIIFYSGKPILRRLAFARCNTNKIWLIIIIF